MRIEIPAPHSYKIVAETNTYDGTNEICVFVTDPSGNVSQDLATIRPAHHMDADWNRTWLDDFNVYVYADAEKGYSTHDFTIKRFTKEEK